MSDLITLTCPSCGGRLEVTNAIDRYVCAHCGNSHIVDPGVRAESLATEVAALKNESAIRRLETEIESLEKRKQELRLAKPFLKSPDFEVALVKWFFVVVLVAGAIAVMVIGLSMNASNSGVYLIMSIPFWLGAVLLGKFGLVDKRSLAVWRVRQATITQELTDIERQLARRREELERRKKLPAIEHHQPTTNN